MANIAIANKAEILEDAKEKIMQGHTLAQIALHHGIGLRTLETWLHKLGEDYVELRAAWVDSLLMDAGQEIEDTLTPVITNDGKVLTDKEGKVVKAVDKERVARARELWKRATWYAERRDQRYAAKTEHKQDLSLSITVNRSLPEQSIIEGECVTLALPKKEK